MLSWIYKQTLKTNHSSLKWLCHTSNNTTFNDDCPLFEFRWFRLCCLSIFRNLSKTVIWDTSIGSVSAFAQFCFDVSRAGRSRGSKSVDNKYMLFPKILIKAQTALSSTFSDTSIEKLFFLLGSHEISFEVLSASCEYAPRCWKLSSRKTSMRFDDVKQSQLREELTTREIKAKGSTRCQRDKVAVLHGDSSTVSSIHVAEEKHKVPSEMRNLARVPETKELLCGFLCCCLECSLNTWRQSGFFPRSQRLNASHSLWIGCGEGNSRCYVRYS